MQQQQQQEEPEDDWGYLSDTSRREEQKLFFATEELKQFQPQKFSYLVPDDRHPDRDPASIASRSMYFDRGVYPKRVVVAYERAPVFGYDYYIFSSLDKMLEMMMSLPAEKRRFYPIVEESKSFKNGQSPAVFLYFDQEIDYKFRIKERHGDSIDGLIRISHEMSLALMESFFFMDLAHWHFGVVATYVTDNTTKWSCHEYEPVPFASVDELTPFMRNVIKPAVMHLVPLLPGTACMPYTGAYRSGEPRDMMFTDFDAYSRNRNFRCAGNTKGSKCAPLKPYTVPGLNDEKLSWHGVKHERHSDDPATITDSMVLCINTPGFWNRANTIRAGQFRTLPLFVEVKKNLIAAMSEENLKGRPFRTGLRAVSKILFGHECTPEGEEGEAALENLSEFIAQEGERACSSALALLGYMQGPTHELSTEYYIRYAHRFLLAAKQDLSLALADLFTRRLFYWSSVGQRFAADDIAILRGELVAIFKSHRLLTPMIEANAEFPADQWVAFAAGHLITVARIELANDGICVLDLPKTAEGRARLTGVFPRLLDEAHSTWRYLALHFHEVQLKFRLDEAIPGML